MDRQATFGNIVDMFLRFPPEIQEAFIAGYTVGVMEAKSSVEAKNDRKDS